MKLVTFSMHLSYSISVKCPKGWLPFSNKCYLWSYQPLVRSEAESLCADKGAGLVEIDSQEESDFVVHQCFAAR